MRLYVLGKTVRYSVEIVAIICQQLAIFSPILALLDKITHVIINMDLITVPVLLSKSYLDFISILSG